MFVSLERLIFSFKVRTQCYSMLFSNYKFSYFLFKCKINIDTLESLMIELYLHIKIYLDYFSGRLKYSGNLENQNVLHFEFKCQKLSRLYHNTYVLLLCIYLESCRGYTIILMFSYSQHMFSTGGYNFKINHSKNKMRHGMLVHILLNNLASSLLQHEYYI